MLRSCPAQSLGNFEAEEVHGIEDFLEVVSHNVVFEEQFLVVFPHQLHVQAKAHTLGGNASRQSCLGSELAEGIFNGQYQLSSR